MAHLTSEMIAKLPRSRDEAEAVQSSYFYTGVECKRGHVTYRYTVNNACADCTNRFIVKARQPGNACAFKIPNRRKYFEDDPQLSSKIGVILFNDTALTDWLIGRALRGENGLEPSTLAFGGRSASVATEPPADPSEPVGWKPTAKCGGHTVAQMLGNGWKLHQLIAGGYVE